jgi:small conductance mechanosensitive channel
MSSDRISKKGDDETSLSRGDTVKKADDNVSLHLLHLAIRTVVIIIVAWITIFFFETYFTAGLGIQHFQIQITSSIVTVAISFLVINSIRRIIFRFISKKISHHAGSTISFFTIILISLFATLSLLHQWDINPQAVLVGGGVTAVIIGIALSTIVGNILSGGLVLTTFPAKIGDSILIVSDNLRGRIDEVNLLYTKIRTIQGSEYFVPNNALIQGSIRLMKEASDQQELKHKKVGDEEEDVSFSVGEFIELMIPAGLSSSAPSSLYSGIIIKLTSKFITLASTENNDNNGCKAKEIIIPRNLISSGQCIIVKEVIR